MEPFLLANLSIRVNILTICRQVRTRQRGIRPKCRQSGRQYQGFIDKMKVHKLTGKKKFEQT